MNLESELEILHDTYVGAVNAAVAEDDYAGVDRLAREYEDEALKLIVQVTRAA